MLCFTGGLVTAQKTIWHIGCRLWCNLQPFLSPAAFDRIDKTVSFVIAQIIFDRPFGLIVYKTFTEQNRTSGFGFQFCSYKLVCAFGADLLFGKLSNDVVVLFQDIIKRPFKVFFAGKACARVEIRNKVYKGAFRSASQAFEF